MLYCHQQCFIQNTFSASCERLNNSKPSLLGIPNPLSYFLAVAGFIWLVPGSWAFIKKIIMSFCVGRKITSEQKDCKYVMSTQDLPFKNSILWALLFHVGIHSLM